MAVYSQLQKSAVKLIKKFGKDCILSRTGDQDYTVRAVIADYRPSDRDGQMIQWTDQQALIAAQGLPIVPNPQTDTLDGMQIVTVTKTAPGPVDILYTLQVRR